jgi:hypothetical protein
MLAILLTSPSMLHPASVLYGSPGDATGTVAIFWWWSYALHHGLPLLYNNLQGAPLGSGWELIPFDTLQIAIFAPLSYVVGPVAAYNIGVLISYPLTAIVMFLLARQLGVGVLGSAFAGLAFAFVPYHTEKAQAHLMQTYMAAFPAFLLFTVRWSQGRSWWNLVLAGVMAGLTLWTDLYLTYMLIVAAAMFFAVSVVGSPGRCRGRTIHYRIGTHALGVVVVTMVALLFVPVAIALGARSSPDVSQALHSETTLLYHGLAEVRVYCARPLEYILPWHANPLLPAWVKAYQTSHLHMSNFIEQSLFLGYTVLALAAIGVLFARRVFVTALGVAIAVAGFLFSMPPSETVHSLTIRFPSYYLSPLLPEFRVYARFGMLVMFGTCLLAGSGLSYLSCHLSTLPKGLRAAALIAPFLLTALEFNNVPPTRHFNVLPAPAEYVWLGDQPAGILVEYPLASGRADIQEVHTRQYQLYQMVHLHAMFNGAAPGSEAGQLAASLEPYYSPGVVTKLRQLHIRYVFVHRTDYIASGGPVSRAVNGLQYVATFNDTDVFTIAPGT